MAHLALAVDEAGALMEDALLAEAYFRECEKTVSRWNPILQNAGLDCRLRLPSPRFNRKIGPFRGVL